MSFEILVVEDEEDIRHLISGILEDEGYHVRDASTSAEALSEFNARKPALVIMDVWLKGSDMDGIELLDVFKKTDPNILVIIISGHGTVETAVSAIRKGAYDYIVKPFQSEKLMITAKRALEASVLRQENEDLKGRSQTDNQLIGSSSAICQLQQKIEKIAPTNSRVLISGPSGAGKELVARLIHEGSNRANGPFKAVNAASIVLERFDDELFGIEDANGGAYKTGLLESAHLGTLYIDEVADLPLETQSKLLRLLVDQSFQRVGGNKDIQVDVRIITSTSRNLQQATKLNKFREDLFHRLNVMPVKVPPLMERREDIPELVNHFIRRLANASGLPARKIGEDTMAALQAHEWPGNVRQLRNNVERLLILATGSATDEITLNSLPQEVSVVRSTSESSNEDRMLSMTLRGAREEFERDYLKTQIERFSGNISRTASFIGMERSALHRKLKILGITSNAKSED
ncbi:MAG: sigma-54 dependent transcriptional regulator [Robiginitomaculum sp.]